MRLYTLEIFDVMKNIDGNIIQKTIEKNDIISLILSSKKEIYYEEIFFKVIEVFYNFFLIDVIDYLGNENVMQIGDERIKKLNFKNEYREVSDSEFEEFFQDFQATNLKNRFNFYQVQKQFYKKEISEEEFEKFKNEYMKACKEYTKEMYIENYILKGRFIKKAGKLYWNRKNYPNLVSKLVKSKFLKVGDKIKCNLKNIHYCVFSKQKQYEVIYNLCSHITNWNGNIIEGKNLCLEPNNIVRISTMLVNISTGKSISDCGGIYYTIIKKLNDEFYLAFSNDNYWYDDFFTGYSIYVVISTSTIMEIPFFLEENKNLLKYENYTGKSYPVTGSNYDEHMVKIENLKTIKVGKMDDFINYAENYSNK